jgi:hypothetical protein
MKSRIVIVPLLAALFVAGCGSSSTSTSTTSATGNSGQTATNAAPDQSAAAAVIGFEGMPIEQGPDLAAASTTQTGTVNGIACGATEQLAYHIHAHLAVFANGSPRALPAGIGIPGSVAQNTAQGPIAAGGQCIYWLHTHTADGVIHIESPTQRIYSLGDFFDVWHQPLSRDRVGGLAGKVTAFLDGKPWTKDPRGIPLLPHATIQLDVGSAAPPFEKVSWSQTQL